jgi:hypothetical protein
VAVPPPTGAGVVLIRLATGSTLGIYYFLFVLTWCLLAAWPLSRVTRVQAVGVSIALWAYARRRFCPSFGSARASSGRCAIRRLLLGRKWARNLVGA